MTSRIVQDLFSPLWEVEILHPRCLGTLHGYQAQEGTLNRNSAVITEYGETGDFFEFGADSRASLAQIKIRRSHLYQCPGGFPFRAKYETLVRESPRASSTKSLKCFSKPLLLACKNGPYGYFGLARKCRARLSSLSRRSWSTNSCRSNLCLPRPQFHPHMHLRFPS